MRAEFWEGGREMVGGEIGREFVVTRQWMAVYFR